MPPQKPEAPPNIRELAAGLLRRRAPGNPGATVLLGAGASVSSGIPTWPALASAICQHASLPCNGRDPIDVLVEYLNRLDIPYAERFMLLRPYLQAARPSIGYAHLAQLVRDGLISTVLTTNWDHLVETALLRVLPLEQVKVLVRGEVPDDTIADLLAWRRGSPTVVKLHGDTQARVLMLGPGETRGFGKKLIEELTRSVQSITFVVGQSAQDVDVLEVILGAHQRQGVLYHVRYGAEEPTEIQRLLERAQARPVSGEQPSVLADNVNVQVGDFDTFFTQLNLAVQQQLVEGRREHLRKAERSILDKERIGIGYINYSGITELVGLFTLQIKKLNPDLILFINDPSAPGGMELQRRMGPIMKREGVKIPMESIVIEGQSGSRMHRREVKSDLSLLPMAGARRVLILDSITFSGNTLQMARDAVRAQYPHVAVSLGVLVISQQLFDQEDPDDRLLHQIVTDRHEIFFPWGVTQTTSKFKRRFEGAEEGQGRTIEIVKRPWGTVEVLADDERNSVRLLTIESHQKLSFQRHLCRDELFVALDDNIGLDICAEDLGRDASEYSEAVKSLILEKGDYVLIPRGVWHRTKASMDRVRLLEVSFGLYDQDNDIERRWDDFARERLDGRT